MINTNIYILVLIEHAYSYIRDYTNNIPDGYVLQPEELDFNLPSGYIRVLAEDQGG